MSYVCDQLVYLAHPRTASIATELALARVFRPGLKTKNHHAYVENNGLPVITTVRNPADVIISWWLASPTWHIFGLKHFIENFKHCYLEQDGRMFYFAKYASEILCYDRLQEDFNKMCKRMGVEPVAIEPANGTPAKHPYKMYHTKDTMYTVEKRWHPDILLYEGLK